MFWRFSITANFLPPASLATGHYSLATRHYLPPSAGPSGVRPCADPPPLAIACHPLPNCERSNGLDLAERTLYLIMHRARQFLRKIQSVPPPLAAARPLIILLWPEALNASGSRPACRRLNHRFPLASFSAFLATAQRAPHRIRSLRGGSGSVSPSRLRQPPVRRFRSICATRIFGSNDLGVSKIARAVRRPFTSAARGPASLSELVKSVPTLILRQDRLPLESGSGISFLLDGISDRNGFVLSDVTR